MSKERPILFSGPMVRALLDGSKTQTRRVVRKQFGAEAVPVEMCAETAEGWQTTGHSGRWWDDVGGLAEDAITCPFGVPGHRLWVRETWQGPMWEEGTWDPDTDYHSPKFCEYRADGGPSPEYVDFEDNFHQGWKPSIHMPRWASRITLEVTGVRVERLQDISETDAIAEGIAKTPSGFWSTYGRSGVDGTYSPRSSFHCLWDSINGAESWDANPWVWVVEFKREK